MVFFFTIPILTQDKSEVKDEQISQSSNDDCKELIKLQDALETLKKALSGANIKGKKTIPVYIKKCETNECEKGCPFHLMLRYMKKNCQNTRTMGERSFSI